MNGFCGMSPCPSPSVGQLSVTAGTRQKAGWCAWGSEGASPLYAALGGQMGSAQSSFCAGGVLGFPSHGEPPGGRQKPRLASQQSLWVPQGSDGGLELALISSSAGAQPSMAFLYLDMSFWTGRSECCPRPRVQLGCGNRAQEEGLPAREPAGRPWGCRGPGC